LVPRTLAAKFILIVVLGALLPLALVGTWLTRSAERSGAALLREQLTSAADVLLRDAASRWDVRQGELHLLANNTVALGILASPVAASPGAADSTYLLQLGDAIGAGIPAFSYFDATSRERWATRVVRDPTPQPGGASPSATTQPDAEVSVELPVTTTDGAVIGKLVARIRVASVFPADAAQGLFPGARLAITDAGKTVRSSAPRAVDLFATPMPNGWEVATRALATSPLRFALAAPTAPYVTPFARHARVGLALLISVAIGALVVSVLLTTQVTRSLKQLADAAGAVAAGDLQRTVDQSTDDEIGRVATSFNAMTESLRRTLSELSQQRALAAVGEFAASLSHDVRNSLTAIRVDLQHAIRHLPRDNAGTLLATRTLDSVHRLDSIVSRALRVARSGQHTPTSVDLAFVLQRAMDGAASSFTERGAILETLKQDMPLELEADGPALEQLFLNLLFNAAQSLSAGSHARVEVETDNGDVTVRVIDTGVGIAQSEMSPFGMPLRSTKPDGTGLGLPIARRIAVAHGGDLRVDSLLGSGTTVTVRLPLHATEN
jgi:signal transduction histidine kinase